MYFGCGSSSGRLEQVAAGVDRDVARGGVPPRRRVVRQQQAGGRARGVDGVDRHPVVDDELDVLGACRRGGLNRGGLKPIDQEQQHHRLLRVDRRVRRASVRAGRAGRAARNAPAARGAALPDPPLEQPPATIRPVTNRPTEPAEQRCAIPVIATVYRPICTKLIVRARRGARAVTPRPGRPGPVSRRPRDSPSSSCGGRR